LIYPITIRDGEGRVKRVISAGEALKLYEGNVYTLTPDERRKWNNIKFKGETRSKSYVKVTRERKYEITCVRCEKKVMRAFQRARYCEPCANEARKERARQQRREERERNVRQRQEIQEIRLRQNSIKGTG
jgi:hypothetical protein